MSKNLKLRLKNKIIDKTFSICTETWILTKRDRKEINIFERKVYRRILGPVYDNEKENWRIFTNKEIYAMVKKLIITETVRSNRLCWFGYVQRMGENGIPSKVLYMNLETMGLRGRPRNRWHDEVREDGKLVCGKGWKEMSYNREGWKKLLRMTRNCSFCTCQWDEINVWIIQASHKP